MRIEYVEGRRHHCGLLARALRPEHARAVVALGFNPHRSLVASFEASAFSRALLLDGKFAALGGIIGTLASDEGHVWLAIADHATVNRRILWTEARRHLREISAVKRSLVTTVLEGDAPAMRFARHLGFVPAPCDVPGLVGLRIDLREVDAWQ